MFRDDIELDALRRVVGRKNPISVLESVLIELFVVKAQVAPIPRYVAFDEVQGTLPALSQRLQCAWRGDKLAEGEFCGSHGAFLIQKKLERNPAFVGGKIDDRQRAIMPDADDFGVVHVSILIRPSLPIVAGSVKCSHVLSSPSGASSPIVKVLWDTLPSSKTVRQPNLHLYTSLPSFMSWWAFSFPFRCFRP